MGEPLYAHTGSGGMTSSLSVGIYGPASVRRLASFPLSPSLITGRSNIKTRNVLEDPRFHNVPMQPTELQDLATSQWVARSRPVHTRAEIDAQLQQFE